MPESVLNIEKEDGVTTLTLNRPKAMNALSRELRNRLVGAFQDLGGDDETGVVILTGAGRAFSAGLDLKELSVTGIGDADLGENRPDGADDYDIISAMRTFGRPIIGAVNGVAVTGGFELALACDILIASTEARFADTHARVGILPGWGLSQKLPRMIGIGRAKEISFTGNYMSAEQAEAWGLVNRVVAPDVLLATCKVLARDMLSCVPEALRGIKQMIDNGYDGTLADGLRMEARRSVEHATSVTPEMIAERRETVQKRGRSQTAG
jgi:enoyl-CoA hydratase